MKMCRFLAIFVVFFILNQVTASVIFAAEPVMLSPKSFISEALFVSRAIEKMDDAYLQKQGLAKDISSYKQKMSIFGFYAAKVPSYLLTATNKAARFLVMTGIVFMINVTKVFGQMFKNSDKSDFKIDYYDDGGWKKTGATYRLFDTKNTALTLSGGMLSADTAFSFIETSPFFKAQADNSRLKKMGKNLHRLRWSNLSLGFAPLQLHNQNNTEQTKMPLGAVGFSGGYMFDYSVGKTSTVVGAGTNLNFYQDLNSGQYFIFSQKESLFAGFDYDINSNNQVGLRYDGEYLVGPLNAVDVDLTVHSQVQNVSLHYLAKGGDNFFMVSPGISKAVLERTKGVLNLAYGRKNMQASAYAKLPLNMATAPTIFDTELETGASVMFNAGKSLKMYLNTSYSTRDGGKLDRFYVGGKISFNIGPSKKKKVSSSLAYATYGNVPTEGATLATYTDSVFINNRNASNMMLTIGRDSVTYTYGIMDFDALTAMQEQYLAELDRQLAEGEIEYYDYRAALMNFHFSGGHVPIPEYTLPETYEEFLADMQKSYTGDAKVLYIVSALASYMGDNNYNDEATERFSEYKRISKLSIDEVYNGIIKSRTHPDEDNYVAVCAGIHRMATDILKKCGFEAYNMAFNTESGVYHMVSMVEMDGVIYFIDYDAISSYATDNPEYALMLFSNQRHNTVNASGMYVYDANKIKHVETPDSRLIESALGVNSQQLKDIWSAMSTEINSSKLRQNEVLLKGVIAHIVEQSTSDSLAEVAEDTYQILKDEYKDLKRNFTRRFIFDFIEEAFLEKQRLYALDSSFVYVSPVDTIPNYSLLNHSV